MMCLYVLLTFLLAGMVTGIFLLFNWLMKEDKNGSQKESTPKEKSRKDGDGSADGIPKGRTAPKANERPS